MPLPWQMKSDDGKCHLLDPSPEGFASILWKDGKRAKEAAGIMKITAKDLKELGVIEWIVPEVEPAQRKIWK